MSSVIYILNQKKPCELIHKIIAQSRTDSRIRYSQRWQLLLQLLRN